MAVDKKSSLRVVERDYYIALVRSLVSAELEAERNEAYDRQLKRRHLHRYVW